MASDPTSPIAPARINALVLPLGKLKRERFRSFVARIRKEDTVRLGDISPDTSPDRTLFSPLAFPNGNVLYNFTLSSPPAHHLKLSPFELFREPQLLICVADNTELQHGAAGSKDIEDSSWHDSVRTQLDTNLRNVRSQFPRALHVQLLLFDAETLSSAAYIPTGGVAVPPPAQSRSTTMKTVMCDMTATLLSEMSLKAKAIYQAVSLDVLGSPNEEPHGHQSQSVASNTTALSSSFRVRSLSPPTSAPRDAGASSTPPPEAAVDSSRPTSPAGSENTAPSIDATGDSSSAPSVRNSFTEIAKTADQPQGTKRDRKTISAANLVAERAKSRLKTRQGLLVATLYLHSGRWPDALRELVDNTTRAKAFGDHRWFAKGLENILITLLLLARADMEFTIPSICFSYQDKSIGGKQGPTTNINVATDVRPSTDVDNQKTLITLSSAIPDIIKLIVNSYARANEESDEWMPPFLVSDCIVRLGRLETILFHVGGVLDRNTLQLIINTSPNYSKFSRAPRFSLSSSARREISFLLFRAFPVIDGMTEEGIIDSITILARIASVLSFAGLQRKQSMVYREILTLLTPAFIQARKRGAAEVGVHPAAGLSILQASKPAKLALDGGTEQSALEYPLRGLLVLICTNYGLHLEQASRIENKKETHDSGNPTVNAEGHGFQTDLILRTAWLRSFGGVNIKSDILRLCTNFAEAIPDFEKLLLFVSSTFATVGPERTLTLLDGSTSSKDKVPPVRLSEEEQTRLAGKFNRVVDATSEYTSNMEAPYWDPFLVRDVGLEHYVGARTLLPLSKSNYTSAAAGTVSPQQNQGLFLHDAFGKTSIVREEETIVTGEPTNFLVTLQNPFSFEVSIERLEFLTTGVALETLPQTFLLGPRNIYRIIVQAAAAEPGTLKMTGCRIKVRGCQYQDFSIFNRPWQPAKEVKAKLPGIQQLSKGYGHVEGRFPSSVDIDMDVVSDSIPPSPKTVFFNVLSNQPMLEVTGSSLPQSSLSLLGGEILPCWVTLTNRSQTAMCDFLSVRFKELIHDEEFSGRLVNGFRRKSHSLHESISIPPGESATFEFDIYGVLGLSHGVVLFEYAYLGRPVSEFQNQFHARLVQIELGITVKPTTELLRVDAISMQEGSPATMGLLRSPEQSHPSTEQPANKPEAQGRVSSTYKGSSLCDAQNAFIFLLDLKNSSSNPLWISFYFEGGEFTIFGPEGLPESTLCSRSLVQSGQVTRAALYLPRICIHDYLVGREATEEGRGKGNRTLKSAKTREELCRDALLSNLKGFWEDATASSRGDLNLHGMRLSSAMVETICEPDLSLHIAFSDGANSYSGRPQRGTSFNAHELLTLAVTVTNTTVRALGAVLQVDAGISGRRFTVDMTRHVAWTGPLWREVPCLEPGEKTVVSAGLTFLTPGRYEIRAWAHPLRTRQRPPASDGSEARPASGGLGDSHEDRLLGTAVFPINIVDA